MIQFEELKLSLEELEPDIKDLKEALGLEAMKKEIGELEEAQTSPDFWDDMEKSQKIIQRTSMLKNKVSAYETLVSSSRWVTKRRIFLFCRMPSRRWKRSEKSWRSSAWLPCSQESMTLITRF